MHALRNCTTSDEACLEPYVKDGHVLSTQLQSRQLAIEAAVARSRLARPQSQLVSLILLSVYITHVCVIPHNSFMLLMIRTLNNITAHLSFYHVPSCLLTHAQDFQSGYHQDCALVCPAT